MDQVNWVNKDWVGFLTIGLYMPMDPTGSIVMGVVMIAAEYTFYFSILMFEADVC